MEKLIKNQADQNQFASSITTRDAKFLSIDLQYGAVLWVIYQNCEAYAESIGWALLKWDWRSLILIGLRPYILSRLG